MNSEREFPWQKKVYNFLVSIQLRLEGMFPRKVAKIVDLKELEKEWLGVWLQEFKKQIEKP